MSSTSRSTLGSIYIYFMQGQSKDLRPAEWGARLLKVWITETLQEINF